MEKQHCADLLRSRPALGHQRHEIVGGNPEDRLGLVHAPTVHLNTYPEDGRTQRIKGSIPTQTHLAWNDQSGNWWFNDATEKPVTEQLQQEHAISDEFHCHLYFRAQESRGVMLHVGPYWQDHCDAPESPDQLRRRQ